MCMYFALSFPMELAMYFLENVAIDRIAIADNAENAIIAKNLVELLIMRSILNCIDRRT